MAQWPEVASSIVCCRPRTASARLPRLPRLRPSSPDEPRSQKRKAVSTSTLTRDQRTLTNTTLLARQLSQKGEGGRGKAAANMRFT